MELPSEEKQAESATVAEMGSNGSTASHHHEAMPDAKRSALMRRVDLRLVPILIVVYVMAFLDRINIGNALTLGLPQELHLESYQPNVALVVFYILYILMEIPSNLMLRRFKPHVWLSAIIFFFGLMVLLHGFVQNFSGLVALRIFLGLAEAGVFPGCLYLLSMWYRREEAQRRFTVFYQSCTLAGAFGGLLASAIEKMDGKGGYSGWRWIFILEGLLTIVISVAAFFIIPDFPEDAKWLTEEERQFLVERIREEHESEEARVKSLSLREELQSFFSRPRSYFGALVYFGGVIPGYATAYFIPTIVKGFGYTAISTQLHSVPPFAAAYAFSVLISFASDRVRHRFGFLLLSVFIGLAGVGILLNVHQNVRVEYAGVMLVTIGTYGALPFAVCWFVMNLRGHRERAIGSAWMISFGNLGGMIAPFLFLSTEAPTYHVGYSVVAFALALMGAAAIAYFIDLMRLNRRAGLKDLKFLL